LAKSGSDARAGDVVVTDLDLTYSHDGNQPLAMKLLTSMGVDTLEFQTGDSLELIFQPAPDAI
jgi:hypothetical protein